VDEKNEYQEYTMEKLQYDGLPTGAIETYTGKPLSELSFDDVWSFFTSSEYAKMIEMRGLVQNMYSIPDSMPVGAKGIQKAYTSGHNLLDSEQYDNQGKTAA